MDRGTLLAHRSFWSGESAPRRDDLSALTVAEAALYEEIRFDRIQPGLRLEQERIGYGWLTDHLRQRFATPEA